MDFISECRNKTFPQHWYFYRHEYTSRYLEPTYNVLRDSILCLEFGIDNIILYHLYHWKIRGMDKIDQFIKTDVNGVFMDSNKLAFRYSSLLLLCVVGFRSPCDFDSVLSKDTMEINLNSNTIDNLAIIVLKMLESDNNPDIINSKFCSMSFKSKLFCINRII